jgi:hypothetical protein
MKPNPNPKPDRSAIMREAHRLRRETSASKSDALRMAWAQSRQNGAPAVSAACGRVRAASRKPNACAQPGGLSASLRRYGADRLAERASAFVNTLADGLQRAAIRRRRNVDALTAGAYVIEASKGPNGVFEIR